MNRRVVMLESISGPLYVAILLASLWVLLRGHNEPGGGFIGGLLAVSASVLWAVAHGSKAATLRLPYGSALRLTIMGIAIGLFSGLPALVLGLPYLTHLWGTIPLGFTELKVSTVIIFDLGVYLAVWGGLAGYAIELLGLDEGDEADGTRVDGPPAAQEQRA